jgi:DMSO/TMAO reductase YedYZ molybdopterin-dependent catalytic subunit
LVGVRIDLWKKNWSALIFALAAGLLLLSLANSVSASWTVNLHGAVDNSFSFTLDDLKAMPQTTVESVLLCDGAYVTSGDWTGVQLGYLLDQAGVQEGVQSVIFYASDGYSSNLPISASSNENIIIAYELDGKPLQETLRLVVPEANGEFWIAYLTTIEVSGDPYVPPQRDMTPPVLPPEVPETPQVPTAPTTPTAPSQPTVNQTVTEPAGPSAEEQKLQGEASGSSNIPVQYGYPIIFAAIGSIVAATGYVAYDRRRNGNGKLDSQVA